MTKAWPLLLLVAPVAAVGLSACGGAPSASAPDAGGDLGERPDGDAAGAGAAPFVIVANDAVPCDRSLGVEVCPADSNRELWRIDLDLESGAATETRLTDNSDGLAPAQRIDPDDDRLLALSPDRAWLYVENGLAGSADIYRLAADGSAPAVRLTAPDAADRFIALSSDGQTIWFASDRGGALDLYRMDAATGDAVRNLTDGQDIGEVVARLPDDAGLVLRIGAGFHDPDGTDQDGELYRLGFDGARVRLTDDRVEDRFAALSPDGSLVFFTRFDDAGDDGVPDGGVNLWVVPSDGAAAPRQLTGYLDISLEVMAVTPDGAAIVEHRDGLRQVYRVAPGDAAPVMLSTVPGIDSSYFRLLSADGGTVFYTSNDRADAPGDTEIYAVGSAGGAVTLLTDFDNDSYFMPRAHLAGPDLLLYESPIDGDTDLYAVPTAGGAHRNLTRNDGWEDQLHGVSGDGAYVLFSNLSDDPIYEAGGALSPNNDQDLFIARTDGAGPIFQVTDNRVYDELEAIAIGAAPVVVTAAP